MVIKRGEFKGKPMIYIYKNQEDADRAEAGEKVFAAFQCGPAKAEAIIHNIEAIYQFVCDEGSINANYDEKVLQPFIKLVRGEE